MMLNPQVCLIVLLVIATVTDFHSRRIPNWLTLTGFCIGLLINIVSAGVPGAIDSLLGAVVGIIIFLPVYALGKMGAGDVKLLAMVGAFLGPVNVFWAALFSLMGGGVLAIGWLIYKIGPRTLFYSTVGSLAVGSDSERSVGSEIKDSPLKAKMPFAAAIAVGTVATWHFEV